MKKSLIALAVLAAAGAASAQSSVTLFGIVDVALSHGSGSIADRTQVVTSGYNSSRLGFRGVEDLGGGMSASFWLEAGFNPDSGIGQATNVNNQATGTNPSCAITAPGTCVVNQQGAQGLTFNRRSTVSLAGGWGEIRLGRDYSPQFWNLTVFDPYGTNGVGTTQVLNSSLGGPTAVRASNSIAYFLPAKIGGFYGQVQHWRGENLQTGAATEGDGTGTGLRVGYANGPFNVALALAKTDFASGDIKTANLGGQWDFGVAKLMGHIQRDDVDGGAEGTGWLLGALVPVGAGEIRVAYSQYDNDLAGEPETKKLALGYVHNLSKRTAVYATVARVRNSGGAAQALGGSSTAANDKSTGYDFGVRHSF